MLVRRQGSGTFVRARVEKNFSKLTSFSEDMRARGRNPRSVWLRKAAGSVTPEEALTLRASPGTPVYRFHRIRFADDAPMALEYATILAACLPSVDAVESSLYAALARLAERLRQTPPRAVVTCARGSSDHAATFARYLIETRLGLLTSSAAPSVSSVYEAQPDLAGTLVLVIS